MLIINTDVALVRIAGATIRESTANGFWSMDNAIFCLSRRKENSAEEALLGFVLYFSCPEPSGFENAFRLDSRSTRRRRICRSSDSRLFTLMISTKREFDREVGVFLFRTIRRRLVSLFAGALVLDGFSGLVLESLAWFGIRKPSTIWTFCFIAARIEITSAEPFHAFMRVFTRRSTFTKSNRLRRCGCSIEPVSKRLRRPCLIFVDE